MPTYSYKHIDTIESPNCTDEFDITQSIKDAALTKCPGCNEPVKRIITSAPGVKWNCGGNTPKFFN